MSEQFTNYGVMALAAPCGSSDVAITVTNPSILPTVGTWPMICESEIMTGTSRTGAVVSVLRGQEGTSAAAHAASTPVTANLTARALRQLLADAAAAAANPWTTLLDLDFTTQDAQTLATDTTFTIGGVVWTKRNSAQESASVAVLPGTGLTWFPSNDSEWNPGRLGLPYLWVPLTSLMGTMPLDWGTRTRIFLSIGADNNTASPQGQVVGIVNLTAALGAPDSCLLCKRGRDTLGQGTAIRWGINGGGAPISESNQYALGTANKTLWFESQALGIASFFAKTFRAPALSPGNPFDLSAFLPALTTGVGESENVTRLGITTQSASAMGLLIGASSSGVNGYATAFQRIRIDARN